MSNDLIQRHQQLVSDALVRNQECLVAQFIRANPQVPIEEIQLIHQVTKDGSTFSVKRSKFGD